MGRAIAAVIAEDERATLLHAIAREDDPDLGRDAGQLAGVRALGASVRAQLELEGADAVIDFSTPEAAAAIARACAAARVPLVTGTTGLSAPQRAELEALAERVPVVAAPNMSVGVTLLFHLAEHAAKILGAGFDAEIVEMHHRLKEDAPSGTAVELARRVALGKGLDPSASAVHGRSGRVGKRPDDQIGVMTLRGGTVIGDHQLILAGAGERVELAHCAQDRSIFARGAVRAAHWVVGKHAGLYDMADVLGLPR